MAVTTRAAMSNRTPTDAPAAVAAVLFLVAPSDQIKRCYTRLTLIFLLITSSTFSWHRRICSRCLCRKPTNDHRDTGRWCPHFFCH